MRKFLFVGGGVLVGWLTIGVVLGFIAQVGAHYLGAQSDSAQTVAGGLGAIVGMIAGGAIGSRLSRAKSASPASSQPATTTERVVAPARSAAIPAPAHPNSDLQRIEQLKSMAELVAQGVLSHEEFNAARERLLRG